MAFGYSLPALHLLRLRLTDSAGALLSENTYWRYRVDTDMRALNQVAATSVSVSLKQSGDGYGAVVKNTGKTVAAMVRLSLREHNGKDRVLPTLYGDNYFWLLPGGSRTGVRCITRGCWSRLTTRNLSRYHGRPVGGRPEGTRCRANSTSTMSHPW